MKKYQKIWKKIKKECKGSPGKSIEKYYRNVLNSRRNWVKDNDITDEEMEEMILDAIGSQCVYCGDILNVKGNNQSISLDHIKPKNRGGSKKAGNLNLRCCKRCNKRKGLLTHIEFEKLLGFLYSEFEDEATDYILKQLSMHSYWS